MKPSRTMPSLFIGHGSPMNAIARNDYTVALNRLGERLEKPQAVLCVSAHWQTRGTMVTSAPAPQQIYHFYGFPDELYKVKYSPPGSPQLAEQLKSALADERIGFDNGNWGLDHGAWSILLHLFPNAEVPVLQLSLDVEKNPKQHFEFASKLTELRKNGVLILGSGNVVHNLRTISWNEKAAPEEWANSYHEWVKQNVLKRNWNPLIDSFLSVENGRLAVPTTEHYLPLLYCLGSALPEDKPRIIFDQIQNATISMLSVALE